MLPMFLCRLREYNIANEQWEMEDNTLDPLPVRAGVNLFVEGDSMYNCISKSTETETSTSMQTREATRPGSRWWAPG